jgi:hypothetical protein
MLSRAGRRQTMSIRDHDQERLDAKERERFRMLYIVATGLSLGALIRYGSDAALAASIGFAALSIQQEIHCVGAKVQAAILNEMAR